LRQAKKVLTKKHVPAQIRSTLEQVISQLDEAKENLPREDTYERSASCYVQADAICTRELLFSSALSVMNRAEGLVPEGALVVGDPVLQYLNCLLAGVAPKQVFVAFADTQRVAEESIDLCVAFPLIHGVGEQESIYDSGSQIVSMVQAVAVEMGIGWDPDVFIYMQSANGQVEQSVGLARNVAFRFDGVTLYLQVHIIRNPAYKVLLGRPFEVLTKLAAANDTDGSQLLTLTDPNTQRRCVVPTFKRGIIRQLKKVRDTSTEIKEAPAAPEKVSSDFQNSMN
jgi:hypothetical protein